MKFADSDTAPHTVVLF